MKGFQYFIKETKKSGFRELRVYHGDNYGTSRININRMLVDNSNNQEGVGIYFGSLDVAKTYGKDIIFADINLDRFVDSRTSIIDVININTIIKILQALWKSDPEAMWYYMTDFGLEIPEVFDIKPKHLRFLAKALEAQEVRNFQIELVQIFDLHTFVNAWNHYTDIDGTHSFVSNDDVGFFAIINPNIEVYKL